MNLQAVTDDCIREKRDVVVLCSGWEDKINIEDTLFGGALVEILQSHGFQPAGDSAMIACVLWQQVKTNLPDYIRRTEHYERLRINGLEDNVPYCLTLNQSKLVPEYSKEEKCLIIRNEACNVITRKRK